MPRPAHPRRPLWPGVLRRVRRWHWLIVLFPLVSMARSCVAVHLPGTAGAGPVRRAMLEGLAFSLGPSLVMFALIITLRVWESRIRRRAAAAGFRLCPECEYPLDAPEGRCPECGTPYTAASLQEAWTRR